MAIFPESKTRRPIYGYDPTPLEKVKRTDPEAGNSFIRDQWGAVRFFARMDFILNLADGRTLWSWYKLNRLLAFDFFDFRDDDLPLHSIGTGNGSTLAFTVKGKELISGSLVIKVAGGAKTEGVDYSITRNSGPLTEDQITFFAAPANGAAIEFTSGRGRRRYSCEFAEAASIRQTDWNKVLISMRVRERFPLGA